MGIKKVIVTAKSLVSGVNGNSLLSPLLNFEICSLANPSQVELKAFSLLDIPLENNSVVELKMGAFMGHFSHFRWQLQEAWRILSPGGKFTVTIIQKKVKLFPNPEWIKSKLSERFKRGKTKMYQYYSKATLTSLAEPLGYKVLSEKKRGLFETQFLLVKPEETFFEWSARCLKKFYPETFYSANMNLQKDINSSKQTAVKENIRQHEIFKNELAGKNILILSPHPDDEIIGCGGMIIEGIAMGANVRVIQITDGAKSKSLQSFSAMDKRKLRLIESQRVSEHLGFEMKAWAHPQEDFFVKDSLIKKLQAELDNFQPQMIFVPSPKDSHPDHQRALNLLAKALAARQEPGSGLKVDIYGYEIWSLSDTNTRLDITASMEKKIGEIYNYKLAMRMENYVYKVLENNRYHALKLNKPSGYAEGYQRMSAEAFVQLMEGNPAAISGEV